MAKKKKTAKKKVELPHLHWLVIGDWSDDGHNDKEFISFRCTHNEAACKKGYLAACKKGKVALHDDHAGGSIEHVVCCDYEDSRMTEEAREALVALGVDMGKLDGGGHTNADGTTELGARDIAVLFAEMVKTQIDGFDYEIPENTRLPTINGYWSKDFNLSFGYGVTGR